MDRSFSTFRPQAQNWRSQYLIDPSPTPCGPKQLEPRLPTPYTRLREKRQYTDLNWRERIPKEAETLEKLAAASPARDSNTPSRNITAQRVNFGSGGIGALGFKKENELGGKRQYGKRDVTSAQGSEVYWVGPGTGLSFGLEDAGDRWRRGREVPAVSISEEYYTHGEEAAGTDINQEETVGLPCCETDEVRLASGVLGLNRDEENRPLDKIRDGNGFHTPPWAQFFYNREIRLRDVMNFGWVDTARISKNENTQTKETTVTDIDAEEEGYETESVNFEEMNVDSVTESSPAAYDEEDGNEYCDWTTEDWLDFRRAVAIGLGERYEEVDGHQNKLDTRRPRLKLYIRFVKASQEEPEGFNPETMADLLYGTYKFQFDPSYCFNSSRPARPQLSDDELSKIKSLYPELGKKDYIRWRHTPELQFVSGYQPFYPKEAQTLLHMMEDWRYSTAFMSLRRIEKLRITPFYSYSLYKPGRPLFTALHKAENDYLQLLRLSKRFLEITPRNSETSYSTILNWQKRGHIVDALRKAALQKNRPGIKPPTPVLATLAVETSLFAPLPFTSTTPQTEWTRLKLPAQMHLHPSFSNPSYTTTPGNTFSYTTFLDSLKTSVTGHAPYTENSPIRADNPDDTPMLKKRKEKWTRAQKLERSGRSGSAGCTNPETRNAHVVGRQGPGKPVVHRDKDGVCTVIRDASGQLRKEKVGSKLRVGSEVKVGSKLKVGSEVKVCSKVKVGSKLKVSPELKVGSESKTGSKSKVGPEFKNGSDSELENGSELKVAKKRTKRGKRGKGVKGREEKAAKEAKRAKEAMGGRDGEDGEDGTDGGGPKDLDTGKEFEGRDKTECD